MKFKDYYDADCAKLISDKISLVYGNFESSTFQNFIARELEGKEFLQRQDLFVDAFEQFLTGNFENDISLFHEILGPELQTTSGMFTSGWWLWPIGRYVERHGTLNCSLSRGFIYELTKRFTGEFAIRPLIEKEPKKTMNVIEKWSRDTSVHVRRLASEGMRISLPWAKKSFAAVNEFSCYKQVLANLKSDPEKFVQKSVGNNLNDLMKLMPEAAYEIIDEWEKDNPSKETLWIIKHGRRSLKKK